jgi:fructose-1,6-bisphosphatase/inositol monophosphatase family enzyme
VDDDALVEVLDAAAAAVRAALDELDDWGLAGTRPGQHHSDLRADAAAIAVLDAAGFGVLSEESGLHHPERDVVVVLDPVDGSTNAAQGVPWFATSLCALDADGARAAVVINQASGERFEARRGGGARRNGQPIAPSSCTQLAGAVVGLSGWPGRHLGWRQYRTLGAAALDLCSVACGRLDAYIDCTDDAQGPWDYLGALLVCREVGVVVVDVAGRPMVVRDPQARRTPVAAATQELHDEVLSARTPGV